MKKLIIGLSLFSLYTCFVGCGSKKDAIATKQANAAVDDSCGIPKLRWQKEEYVVDSEKALKVASAIVASAQADAKISKDLAAKGQFTTAVTSELAKTLSQNVTKSSSVSQEFWEQDLAFRQSQCFMERYTNRSDLTPAMKEEFQKQILSLIQARQDYMFGVTKKKTGG